MYPTDKETPRNTAVYGIQNNRNPFIDYPGLGVMYNMAGQVVAPPYKGLVIMNGRKFVNKYFLTSHP